LLEKELKFLSDAIEHAKRPFVAVLGGAKVSDKLGAIRNLLARVDTVLVGGAMAYTFLKAKGIGIGGSKVEDDMLAEAKSILAAAESGGKSKLVLPSDHVCAQKLEANAPTRVTAGAIPDGWLGLDIGPATREQFSKVIRGAKTVVWNGPMGVFETPPFDAGTRAVAAAMGEATKAGGATIVGGGDSAAAAEAFGMESAFSHISTGGGASLQMLEGQPFDSVQLLDNAPEQAPAPRRQPVSPGTR
jgi:phosphoglycerate kinase